MHAIANYQLSLVHLPRPNSPILEWHLFAGTFDGYEYCGSLEDIISLSKKIEQAFHDDPSSLSQFDLSELRSNLFFEHRRFINFGREPDENEFRLWTATVQEIEKKIRNHQLT